METFTPPIGPSPGTETDFQTKILRADFGDGYQQAGPDGLNHIKRSVTLTWAVLTVEQAQAMEDFFVARGGYEPFRYSLSNDIERQWTCATDWKRTRDLPNTFTCVLVEDFTIIA